ncbi:MAG TPA: diguanylate cyclase, partial [Acidimicrobiales bacterium]|nr:diguanylate cyclase [Acidimicrobiales bacterium]
PSGFGLRTRLLILVLVPAILLAGVGGAAILRQQRAASTLSEVHDEVGVLSGLTELRRALLGARAPIELEVRAGTVGLDRDDAVALLAVDQIEGGDLDDVAARLRELPRDARPFSVARLDALRDASEEGADVDLIDRYDQLDQLTRQQWERRLRTLRAHVVDSGSTELDERLNDLEASTRAGSAAGAMATKLADYWFGIVADNDRAGPARTEIAVAAQQFDAAMATLATSADPQVAAVAKSILAAKPDSPFGAAVDDAVAARPPAPLADGVDLAQVAATFRSSVELFQPLLDAMEARSAQLDATAASLAAQAERTLTLSILGLIASLVLLLVISLAVAASLDRPLSRLIEGIRRVGEGDLGVGPLPVEGPVEFAEATAALNDVVANLSRVEGKVDALATGGLDDPRLQEPLPGALGESLERSIQLLSDSIADRNALQARLAYQATHDALTLLPNRPGALDALDRAIARSKRTRAPLAVLFLDLDGFKAVNDTFGHQTGDDVLCEVARRLDDEARAGDFCARLGGDEFVVVAENVAGPEGAAALARRVTQRIAEPFTVGPAGLKRTHLGVSIGIALRTEDNDTPLSVLARADEAAYRAKRAGTGVEVAR